MGYYCRKHIPMVQQRLGKSCKGVIVEKGLSGLAPGRRRRTWRYVICLFDSVEVFQSAFTPHAGTFAADIPNYTNIEPVIQISEVVM